MSRFFKITELMAHHFLDLSDDTAGCIPKIISIFEQLHKKIDLSRAVIKSIRTLLISEIFQEIAQNLFSLWGWRFTERLLADLWISYLILNALEERFMQQLLIAFYIII